MDDRRALWTATAAYVLGWSAHTTFIFYLGPVALRLAGVVDRDAWLFTGTALASILAALPAGRLTDRYPRRRVLRGALVLLALSYVPLLLPAPSFGAALTATLLTGTGLGFLFVAFNAYVPDLLAKRHMASAYGTAGAVAVLASAAGPALAATVFAFAPDVAGLRLNAALFGAGALLGVALTLGLPSVRRQDEDSPAVPAPLRQDLPVVVPAFLIYALVGAGYGMTLPYFTVYFLDHLHMPKETWGFVLAAGTVATALSSLAAGRLARGRPAGPILVGAQVALALVSLSFLTPAPVALLALAFVARNLFSATTAPLVSTIMMSRIAAGTRGRAQALGTLAWNVGWAAGAAGGGVLLGTLAGGLFPLGAILAVMGVAAGAALFARAGRGGPGDHEALTR